MTDLGPLYEELAELEHRIERLEVALGDLDELRDRLDAIDERTDLMQLVDDSDDLDGEGRSVRLLQHMQRKASRNSLATIALTQDQADEALHYPDVHRTTLYTDMRRCQELLGDEAICWYETQDEGTIDEARIHLDMEAFRAAVDSGQVEQRLVDESTAVYGGA